VKTSDDVQNLLKIYLGHNIMLFVGYSSEFEDPNFNGLLEWASSREKNIPNHHYLLVRDGDIRGQASAPPREITSLSIHLRAGTDISVRGSSRKDLRISEVVEGGKEEAEKAFVTLK
jgi:hypothetical protein